MHNQKKQFPRPPKKHEPKGMRILYEDRDLIIVDKICGLLTMGNAKEAARTAQNILMFYVQKGNLKSPNRVFIVHRLDRDTSGVLVFAKSKEHKEYLQNQWHEFSKTYYAVVHGKPKKDKGIIQSYLVESGVHKVYSTKDPNKGKLAKTEYEVINSNDDFSLLKIKLHTGRKHQIRVHFADMGCAIVGDKKYDPSSKGFKRLCLHAGELTIKHPYNKQTMVCPAEMPSYFLQLVPDRKKKGPDKDAK